MGSYIPSTMDERRRMLKAIGLSSMEDLFRDVPKEVLLPELPGVGEGMSEMEVEKILAGMADKNRVFQTVLRGAGAYDHYIPAVVDAVAAKESFSTAYTPYQAEISQGVLQSIFEYQTMICELTGMDVSNASVYDGASAAAEAAVMCLKRGRGKVYVASTAHPDTIRTIQTYCAARNAETVMIPSRDGLADLNWLSEAIDNEAACVYLQQPNFFGLLEDAELAAQTAHAAGAKMTMGVYPIALGLIKSPREYGADIAVGEGQPMGIPMSFGGPTLGFMACVKEMARALPGRIVGETTDSRGERAFVLTLQAREQHIRREKAGSNICSNQALCALRCAVYLAALGAKGLSEAAKQCCDKAHYFAEKLTSVPGVRLVHEGEFFNEFVTALPVPAERVERALMARGILPGLPVAGGMLWCVTEKTSRERLDEAVQTLREVASR